MQIIVKDYNSPASEYILGGKIGSIVKWMLNYLKPTVELNLAINGFDGIPMSSFLAEKSHKLSDIPLITVNYKSARIDIWTHSAHSFYDMEKPPSENSLAAALSERILVLGDTKVSTLGV